MSAFDHFLDKAKQMADVAGRKTGEVVESSKYKMQAYKITGNIQKAYEKLGSIVYDSTKYGTDSTQLIESCIAEIDGMLAQLEAPPAALPIIWHPCSAASVGPVSAPLPRRRQGKSRPPVPRRRDS